MGRHVTRNGSRPVVAAGCVKKQILGVYEVRRCDLPMLRCDVNEQYDKG